MNYKLISVILLITLVVLAGCQAPVQDVPAEEPAEMEEVSSDETAGEPADTKVNEEGKKRIEGPFAEMIAPDFTLPDIDGNDVTLSDLRGNAVALVFWTSW